MSDQPENLEPEKAQIPPEAVLPWRLVRLNVLDRDWLLPNDRLRYLKPGTMELRLESEVSPAALAQLLAQKRREKVDELQRMNDVFDMSSPATAELQRIEASLREAAAKAQQNDQAIEAALARAREDLQAGRDPGPAEADYRRAASEKEILHNRVAALGQLVDGARAKVYAERRAAKLNAHSDLLTRARDARDAAEREILAFLRGRLENLIVQRELCLLLELDRNGSPKSHELQGLVPDPAEELADRRSATEALYREQAKARSAEIAANPALGLRRPGKPERDGSAIVVSSGGGGVVHLG